VVNNSHKSKTDTIINASEIVGMFDRIVPRYDLLNHLLSIGFDYSWRKKAVKNFTASIDGGTVLDICSGTGDLIDSLFKHRRCFSGDVIALDGSYQMLLHAEKKAKKKKKRGRIKYILSDAMNLPMKKCSVTAVMAAFGIRNLTDPKKGLEEIFYVLNDGGELVILEFSIPDNGIIRKIYGLYFKKILPILGGIFSGKKSAYSYLVRSVYSFNESFDIGENLQQTGFENIKRKMLTMGIVSLYYAKKPEGRYRNI
jgi:demethylmenaquinone methyltransferase/2-methoxy-6-polyprenyl-1,4-benzoquinol methylase